MTIYIYLFVLLMLILGILAINFIRDQKIGDHSFLYGFLLSFLAYLASSIIFFCALMLRRMTIHNIQFGVLDIILDSIIVPVMVAIPWLPVGIITGLISWKKGNKLGLLFFYIFLLLIIIGLSIVFLNTNYTIEYGLKHTIL